MRRTICAVLVMMLMLLTACGRSASTWQEQYDLGVRYLSEGNYEEAIIAFTAAIEIDPKRAEAYAKAADAYEALGDIEHLLAILTQGVEATGDSSFSKRLASLQNQEQEENSQDQQDTESDELLLESTAVSGTLSLSNVSYSYETGGSLAEMNEEAIGGMILEFTVNGPPNTADAWIGSWSEHGFSEAEISEQIDYYAGIWKSNSSNNIGQQQLPFDSGQGFPVWVEDHGKVVDVLLVGIDENVDPVGYAIVTVAIP